ncbi:hypothetical protein RCL_jg10865.t1 [Rhizophagus clarus]|uniref:Uncharacterized protein n=1 Tax=Rhizophagus clarus TaxID=94130 RepID=A0A8H3L2F5_9GLOM|nr:hypothetical protein RCL_jg10865.t1 [Rhizophagus clarus]
MIFATSTIQIVLLEHNHRTLQQEYCGKGAPKQEDWKFGNCVAPPHILFLVFRKTPSPHWDGGGKLSLNDSRVYSKTGDFAVVILMRSKEEVSRASLTLESIID